MSYKLSLVHYSYSKILLSNKKEFAILQLLLAASLAVTSTQAGHQPWSSYSNAPLYPIHPKLISQSVQLNEVPTKVIKITKTVAVKVPVPYPVKVSAIVVVERSLVEPFYPLDRFAPRVICGSAVVQVLVYLFFSMPSGISRAHGLFAVLLLDCVSKI